MSARNLSSSVQFDLQRVATPLMVHQIEHEKQEVHAGTRLYKKINSILFVSMK